MASDDSQIKIEVVLDDGSVKQTFSNIRKTAEDTQKKISDNSKNNPIVDEKQASSSFASIMTKARLLLINPYAAALVGLGIATKEAFDQALAGEAILALEKNFDRLANSQGLSGLRDQLESASQGLVDVGDLLAKSTNAVLNLGDASARLPELLDLAAKSALSFGTDAGQTFETFVKAVETGNTRILRTQGIIVDSEKVFKDYAKTLGTTAQSLTLAQKQQGLLNAVIEEGNKRVSQFDGNARPLNTAITQLKVSFSQVFEDLSKIVSVVLGPLFTAIVNGIRSVVDSIKNATGALVGGLVQFRQAVGSAKNNPSIDAASLLAKQLQVKFEIDRVNAEIEKGLINNSLLFQRNELPKLNEQLSGLKENYRSLGDQISATGAKIKSFQSGPVGLPAGSEQQGGSSLGVIGLTPEQLAENQRLREQAANQVIQLEIQTAQQLIATKQAGFKQINDVEDQQRASAEIAYEQFKVTLMQREQELAQLETTLGQNRLVTTEQREAARAAIIEKYNNQIQTSTTESQKLIEQREAQISASFTQGITNAVVASAATIGRALAEGKLDFDDFGRSILNILADTAIQVGALVISFGVAANALALSLATFQGYGAIAAGAAMVAIGTAIKAFAGGPGSGQAAVPSAGTPGGAPIQTTSPGDFDSTIGDQIERQAPNTEVNVVIQGDVLDSEDTGLRIVSIINQAFDKQGVIIKRGALA